MKKHWFFTKCAVFAALGMVFPYGAAHAQTAAPKGSSAAVPNPALRDINRAFSYAASQANAAFVVEGEPYKKTLTQTEASAIQPAGTPAEVVAQIARAYDYDATVSTGNKEATVYVFKKRYTDPNDLPFVSLEEMRAVCEEMFRLTATFDSSLGVSRTHSDSLVELAHFGASLSGEQLALMKDKTRGLPVQSLNAQQRAQILSFPLDTYLRSTEQDLEVGVAEARLVTDGSATIGTKGPKDKPVFGYEAPMVFREIKPSRQFRVLNATSNPIKSAVRFVEPGEPQPRPVGSASSKPAPSLSTTLQQSVQQAQIRLAEPYPVVVDAEIATKPVWVVNVPAASPDALLRGLTEVYGLRLTTKVDGVRQISRARQPKPKSLLDFSDALTQLLPDNFSRAMHWRVLVEADKKPRITDEDFLKPRGFSWMALGKRTQEVRGAAALYLKAGIEPTLSSETPKVPVASLNAAEQAALADVVLCHVWEAIYMHAAYPAPEYIKHLDDAIVTGEFTNYNSHKDTSGTEELDGFSVRFYYRDAEGNLKDSIFGGIVNLRAIKNIEGMKKGKAR